LIQFAVCDVEIIKIGNDKSQIYEDDVVIHYLPFTIYFIYFVRREKISGGENVFLSRFITHFTHFIKSAMVIHYLPFTIYFIYFVHQGKISGGDSVFAIHNYLLYVLLIEKKLAVVKLFFINYSPLKWYFYPLSKKFTINN
jgi:hypothetical protein